MRLHPGKPTLLNEMGDEAHSVPTTARTVKERNRVDHTACQINGRGQSWGEDPQCGRDGKGTILHWAPQRCWILHLQNFVHPHDHLER